MLDDLVAIVRAGGDRWANLRPFVDAEMVTAALERTVGLWQILAEAYSEDTGLTVWNDPAHADVVAQLRKEWDEEE